MLFKAFASCGRAQNRRLRRHPQCGEAVVIPIGKQRRGVIVVVGGA